MGSKREMTAAVRNYIAAPLSKIGFRSVGNTFIVKIGQANGSVALNISSRRSDGLVGISPIIGVELAYLKTELALFFGRNDRQPSLTTMLGYLMPEKRYVEWLFDPNLDLGQRRELDNMAKAILQYGVPFIRDNANLERVIANLESLNFSFVERAMYHLPIAYRLAGLEEKARIYVISRRESLQSQTDVASQEYVAFANKFLEPPE
jgi:hypothetical protein